jgi:hypothetical protein
MNQLIFMNPEIRETKHNWEENSWNLKREMGKKPVKAKLKK